MVVILSCTDLQAQNLTCLDWIEIFTKKFPDRTHQLDTLIFCKGVEEAFQESELVALYYGYGFVSDLTDCELYSYRRYGVEVRWSVDGIDDIDIISNYSFYHGYNTVMQERIRDSLGHEKVGVVQDDWYSMYDGFLLQLREDLEAKVISEDSVLVSLNQAPTDTLNQIIVGLPLDSVQNYSFGDLYNGIKFKKQIFKHFFLEFDVARYEGGENYCKVDRGRGSTIIMPLQLEPLK